MTHSALFRVPLHPVSFTGQGENKGHEWHQHNPIFIINPSKVGCPWMPRDGQGCPGMMPRDGQGCPGMPRDAATMRRMSMPWVPGVEPVQAAALLSPEPHISRCLANIMHSPFPSSYYIFCPSMPVPGAHQPQRHSRGPGTQSARFLLPVAQVCNARVYVGVHSYAMYGCVE